ncbi:DNA-binding transcriptional LysR family regulator [Asanoa ferruginea]|uniref:DNA-binding transcriptional LysR family regulator n=1 Tax=Asanoa ferruginea TaxID=53367 RepID=A0A3D9ZZ44_9ACTN|nr:LysR family transcriptional regulator [Asanoa ferruginea]REG02419.1 DNA-binding transcriptional LysR family regulator [Asanoa ferruginea]GIF46654.1 LysR family transcriptional regulator [Asanoa ferruginea]
MLDLVRLRVLAAVARTGSVTAAAKELHYSQPSISHHIARLEAETGARLLQRVGRGIRLTPTGELLAERAIEIIGRVDSAAAELSTHVGLDAGRVRLAGFSSVLSTLVPAAAAALAASHPGLELNLTDTHPPEALRLLRAGKVDVAVVFRYAESPPEEEGIRLLHLLDDPTYLLGPHENDTLAAHRDARWVAGCERCGGHLLELCARAGFTPHIAYRTDDMVAMQAMVSAGMAVTTIPGLALRAHRAAGIHATEIPGSTRHVYAATYGEPPDPPATTALLHALRAAA